MTDVNIGRRVILHHPIAGPLLGTIIQAHSYAPNRYLFEADEPNTSLHNGQGHLPNNRGWWCNVDTVPDTYNGDGWFEFVEIKKERIRKGFAQFVVDKGL